MLNILFAAPEDYWPVYEGLLRDALAAKGIKAKLGTDLPPEEVDYIVYAPNDRLKDFSPFVRCRAVLGLWAGVEKIVGNKTLTMPLARMVDPGLTEGMREWVTGHVMRLHLEMDRHIFGQDGVWRPEVPPLARHRPVTVLGMGALGAACGQALAALGFPVRGWSRSLRKVEGIETFAGPDGLAEALRDAAVVVLLLPDTPETTNVLNAETLALLRKGAFVVNPGRGPLIDDDAMLAALDSGQVGHATLDVFRTEPLPVGHPYWAHPSVTVTPHIASTTRPSSSVTVIAENVARTEAGLPLLHEVDRARGY
ncbi:2-hydroxyacid dehydrogenase [Donghicola tyrosinivorans]|uniref:Glyoxylate/hydroxypyruvate reductase A n=1 Tax=Donghicola tyrosinivorans TaxID=1652492 RepID=A0A2T0WXS3_9RHOB|nr:glyoxylate/hydroxypyruvate reductase A [Donghicola tyrosinivorans]PRY91489.1 glyoxylate/hydroxypyruvate reductase A [Donghicola tyrosinivorans]